MKVPYIRSLLYNALALLTLAPVPLVEPISSKPPQSSGDFFAALSDIIDLFSPYRDKLWCGELARWIFNSAGGRRGNGKPGWIAIQFDCCPIVSMFTGATIQNTPLSTLVFANRLSIFFETEGWGTVAMRNSSICFNQQCNPTLFSLRTFMVFIPPICWILLRFANHICRWIPIVRMGLSFQLTWDLVGWAIVIV